VKTVTGQLVVPSELHEGKRVRLDLETGTIVGEVVSTIHPRYNKFAVRFDRTGEVHALCGVDGLMPA